MHQRDLKRKEYTLLFLRVDDTVIMCKLYYFEWSNTALTTRISSSSHHQHNNMKPDELGPALQGNYLIYEFSGNTLQKHRCKIIGPPEVLCSGSSSFY